MALDRADMDAELLRDILARRAVFGQLHRPTPGGPRNARGPICQKNRGGFATFPCAEKIPKVRDDLFRRAGKNAKGPALFPFAENRPESGRFSSPSK